VKGPLFARDPVFERVIVLGLALVVGAGCKPSAPPPPPAAKAAPPPVSDTPIADQAIAAGEAEEHQDPRWISGTWQQKGARHWFLFNLPAEVAELSGKPARVVRRGKLVIHGRYVSAVFPNGEVHFEAAKDHGQMTTDSPRAVYQRGAPP